jgi:hypothetical protein
VRKTTILYSFILIFTCLLSSQEIIENPEKPLSKNAGRVLELKEVKRIRDGQGFFFSGPIGLKVDHNGYIYVQEYRKLYQFSAEGKFLKNLYIKGEGPGELNDNLGEFLLRDKDIVLWSSNMNKLIRMDYQQKLIEDIRPKQTYHNLLAYFEGKYYLTKGRYPKKDGKSGIKEQGMKLFTEDSQGQIHETSLDFPIQISIHYGDRSVSSMSLSRVQSFQDNESEIYLFHTPEYLVKVLDLEKVEVIRSFYRKYKRIENERKSERLPRYQNDIYWLLLSPGQVWVVTSTFDQQKGLLVDVFSREGHYLDNFFLPILGAKRDDWIYAPMTLADGYLFVIERGEDELFSVVKYSLPVR